MTRFARAKGSKASNERLPEEATSWREMKQQMLDKGKESADEVARRANDQKRSETYRAFLEQREKEQEGAALWADIPVKAAKGSSSQVIEQGDDDDAPLEVSSKIKTKTLKVKTKKAKKKKLKLSISAEHAKKMVSETASADEKPETLTGMDQDKHDEKPVLNPAKKKDKLAAKLKKKKIAKGPQVKKEVKKELTKEDLEKIEKKKQRRLRQIKKRKEMKEKAKEQGAPNTSDAPNGTAKPVIVKGGPKAKSNNLPGNLNKSKVKDPKNKDFKRKKPFRSEKIMVNGKELTLAYFDGFPIKIEDVQRLNALRKEMISKGLPRSQIKAALKLERRRAEKALSREKKMVCFQCRVSGHNLSECPELLKDQTNQFGTGVCFKCGSTEHTHFQCKVVKGEEYKFATCFICKEQGHISRQCPDNARGLYPKGGACKVCGDVTHLKKDCPQHQAQQQSTLDAVKVETLDDSNPDVMEIKTEKTDSAVKTPKTKIVKLA